MYLPNPFPGAPTHLRLSGLFLIAPSVHVSLSRHTARANAVKIARLESNATTATQPRIAPRETATNDAPLKRADTKATRTNAASDKDTTGDWEAFYGASGPALTYPRLYRLRIERACRQVLRNLQAGEFDKATETLLTIPEMSPVLWTSAVDAFDARKPSADLMPVQVAVAMEVELSCLAALDVDLESACGRPHDSRFSILLPETSTPDLNPSARFFRWILKECGMPAISDSTRLPELGGASVHPVTLRKWNAGKQLPSEAWLNATLDACGFSPDRHEAGSLYWATKILTMLGYYADRYVGISNSDAIVGVKKPAKPQANAFPHGHATFADWAAARYPFWLAYHRERRSFN